MSLAFAYDFPHLQMSPVGLTTSDVSFPSLYTSAGGYRALVSYRGVCCAINFCLAWDRQWLPRYLL